MGVNKKRGDKMSLAVISITNKCNLKCRMCDIGQKNKDNSLAHNLLCESTLKPKEWINILKKIQAQKVNIIGVEPLLYDQLDSLLSKIKKNNIKIELTTNGWLFEKWEKELIKYCDIIWVSIDGSDAETHDFNRGVKGSFNKAINAVKTLYQNNKKVKISYCILPNNIDQMHKLNKMFKVPIVFNHFNYIHPKCCKEYNILSSNLSNVNLDDFDAKLILDQTKKCNKNAIFVPDLKTIDEISEYYHILPNQRFKTKNGCKIINQLVSKKRYVINSDGTLILGNRCWIEADLGYVLDYIKNKEKQYTVTKIAQDIKNKGFQPPCQRLCCSGKLL